MKLFADSGFTGLYNRHYESLVKLASKRLLNPHKADDIVQDKLVVLLEYNIKNNRKGYSLFILKRNIIIQCAKENKQDRLQVELKPEVET